MAFQTFGCFVILSPLPTTWGYRVGSAGALDSREPVTCQVTSAGWPRTERQSRGVLIRLTGRVWAGGRTGPICARDNASPGQTERPDVMRLRSGVFWEAAALTAQTRPEVGRWSLHELTRFVGRGRRCHYKWSMPLESWRLGDYRNANF